MPKALKDRVPFRNISIGRNNPRYDRLECKLCEKNGTSFGFAKWHCYGPTRRIALATMIQHMLRHHKVKGDAVRKIAALEKALVDVIDFGEHGPVGEAFTKEGKAPWI